MCFSVVGRLGTPKGRAKVVTTPLGGDRRGYSCGFAQSAWGHHGGKFWWEESARPDPRTDGSVCFYQSLEAPCGTRCPERKSNFLKNGEALAPHA